MKLFDSINVKAQTNHILSTIWLRIFINKNDKFLLKRWGGGWDMIEDPYQHNCYVSKVCLHIRAPQTLCWGGGTWCFERRRLYAKVWPLRLLHFWILWEWTWSLSWLSIIHDVIYVVLYFCIQAQFGNKFELFAHQLNGCFHVILFWENFFWYLIFFDLFNSYVLGIRLRPIAHVYLYTYN